MVEITVAHIIRPAPKAKVEFKEAFAAESKNKYLEKAGITQSPLRPCHFMAHDFTRKRRFHNANRADWLLQS